MHLPQQQLMARILRPIFQATTLFLLFTSNIQAQTLDHQTQRDVLNFLSDYQPAVISADREMNLQTLGKELAKQQVVFVAEQHDRYDHHLNQLALLRLMHQQNPALSIGVEWFQQSFQNVLNDYLAGNLTETAMLQQSGYYERWRYDFRMLRPILEYAREHRLAVIALNAPAEITRKVSMGGLAALSADERAQLPATIHPPQENYRQYLKSVFDEHMAGQGDFDRFALIQRIWDETMAANIVAHLKSNGHVATTPCKHESRCANFHNKPQQRMIVFAGSGHLSSGAIPGDVTRDLPKAQVTTIHSAAREEVSPGTFDYFIVSEALSLPPTGKLGVWLEDQHADQSQNQPEPYVAIRQLAEDSAAGDAGMLQGDRFISLNGQPVQSTADLLLVLAKTRSGQEITVRFSRLAKKNTAHSGAVTIEKHIKLK